MKKDGNASNQQHTPNTYEAPGCQGQKTPLTK